MDNNTAVILRTTFEVGYWTRCYACRMVAGHHTDGCVATGDRQAAYELLWGAGAATGGPR